MFPTMHGIVSQQGPDAPTPPAGTPAMTSATPAAVMSTNLQYGYAFTTPPGGLTIVGVRVYAGHALTEEVRIWSNSSTAVVFDTVTCVPNDWATKMLAAPVNLAGSTAYRIGTIRPGAVSRDLWRTNSVTWAAGVTAGVGYWGNSPSSWPGSSTSNRAMVDFLFT